MLYDCYENTIIYSQLVLNLKFYYFSDTPNEKPINRKQKGKNRYKEELNKSDDSIKVEDFDENQDKSDKKLLSISNTNKSSK